MRAVLLSLTVAFGGIAAAAVGCSMLVDTNALSEGEADFSRGGDASVDASAPGLPDEEPEAPEPDPGTELGEPEPEPTPTEDAGADAGADAGDSNPCAGRPDGFAFKPGAPAERCCGGQPSRIDARNNCGSCGIVCPVGFACGNPVAGQWGCTCNSNLDCRNSGYGAAATCYTFGGGSFCNCQCPSEPAVCNGVCLGGAACHDVTGQNYCAYP